MSEQEKQAREQLFADIRKAFIETGKVLGEAATGSGKSYATLKLIKEDIKRYAEPWEIVVPSTKVIQSWWDEIDKWRMKTIMKKYLKIYCYQSLHLYNKPTNMVFDEVHKLTDLRYERVVDRLENKRIIALSASVNDEVRIKLALLGINNSNTVTYNLDNAVSDELVAPYKIDVVELSLDHDTKNITAGSKSKPFQTTEALQYQYLDKVAKKAMMSSNKNFAKFKILERMRFIYNLPSKLRAARDILDVLPEDKKVLIFAGSIAQADSVCEYRYHSNTDDTDYQKFCKGKIMRLSVVEGITEGVNIPNLDYILMIQAKSNAVYMIQKIGRLLRKTEDASKVGHVIILETIGTQDTRWVVKALDSFDPSRINYVSYNQILQRKKVVKESQ